jgi:hypothetical protein
MMSAIREILGQGVDHVDRRRGEIEIRYAMNENPTVEMIEDLNDERRRDGLTIAIKAKRGLWSRETRTRATLAELPTPDTLRQAEHQPGRPRRISTQGRQLIHPLANAWHQNPSEKIPTPEDPQSRQTQSAQKTTDANPTNLTFLQTAPNPLETAMLLVPLLRHHRHHKSLLLDLFQRGPRPSLAQHRMSGRILILTRNLLRSRQSPSPLHQSQQLHRPH